MQEILTPKEIRKALYTRIILSKLYRDKLTQQYLAAVKVAIKGKRDSQQMIDEFLLLQEVQGLSVDTLFASERLILYNIIHMDMLHMYVRPQTLLTVLQREHHNGCRYYSVFVPKFEENTGNYAGIIDISEHICSVVNFAHISYHNVKRMHNFSIMLRMDESIEPEQLINSLSRRLFGSCVLQCDSGYL